MADPIRIARTSTSLGHALIGWTDRGIGFVHLGDDPEAGLDVLQVHFRGAEPVEAEPGPWVDAAVRALEGEETEAPLDPPGSEFQRRVWDKLAEIPRGDTWTYTELTTALGEPPTSARAVARACATNPIAVLVPCHRVLRADGELGGYRWGLDRKRTLLDREGARRLLL